MDSELYMAVISGNINILCQNKEKLGTEAAPDESSVLHLASQLGKTECVREILKMHPSLLRKLNSSGETALHLAAKGGHSDVVKALIDEAKKSQPPNDIEPGVGSSIKQMMIRMRNKENDTALHEAARYNRLDVVTILVNEDPEDLHAPNQADETPMYLAAYRGYVRVVAKIYGICISPAYGGSDGRTVLHASVISCNSELVKMLLRWKQALVKETDKHGWTALHYAAYFDYKACTACILKVDKSVAYLADNNAKRTALHIAAGRDNIDVMEEIIRSCPDCFVMVDKRGRNVLHIAVERLNKKVIRYVLQSCHVISTLLGQKDENGNTPLHLLTMYGCFVPEIITHDMADIEALNNKNLTPLDSMYYDPRAGDDNGPEIVQKLFMYRPANKTYNLWTVIGDESEFEEKQSSGKARERLEKMNESHMIVSALIATITFTAGFTLPGGYDGNQGPNQGMAVLTRKSAFKAFMVADTIALLLSTTTLVMYFLATIYRDISDISNFFAGSIFLNILAIVATMIAFITGTYAVIGHSSALSITLQVIGCSFFLVLFFIFRNCYRASKYFVLEGYCCGLTLSS